MLSLGASSFATLPAPLNAGKSSVHFQAAAVTVEVADAFLPAQKIHRLMVQIRTGEAHDSDPIPTTRLHWLRRK